MTVPKFVFIIPYRDREEQLFFFRRQIKFILEDYDPNDYRIFYIHQQDTRTFNRGAMKNIGFRVVKDLYPQDYTTISIVFNDVDTIANRKILDYQTTIGTIKHYYGFTFALGGIVSITGSDFEQLNGFPTFWRWGYEDTALNQRALAKHMHIDRSQFYKLMDPHIIHLNESTSRVVNRADFDKYKQKSDVGLREMHSIQYTIDEETQFVNVTGFETGIPYSTKGNLNYDITKSNPLERMPMFL